VELERRSGKLTRDVIDYVGGTSTGAALAAVIAVGLPASEALKVYTEKGRAVFSPANRVFRTANLITKARQFDNRVLHDVISKSLGGTTMTINDSPVGIMITAVDQMGTCWYFTQDRKTNLGTTGKADLIDVTTASCCATTYHESWMIPGFGWFADGGTGGEADPVNQTMAEAFSGYECYGSIDPAAATVVSLGTGWYKPAKMPNPPGNVLAAITWVTGSLVGSSKTNALRSAQRHWPGIITTINPLLWADVDEADVDAIPMLLEIGKKTAAEVDWSKFGL
jgi:uncharacterized protein